MVGNPSYMLNLITTSRYTAGFGYCYSCAKGGPWEKLADRLGLEKFAEGDDQESWAIRPDFAKLGLLDETVDTNARFQQMCDAQRVPLNLGWQEGVDWRHISGDTLSKIGARYGLCEKLGEQVAMLPVIAGDELQGVVKGRWKKVKGEPSFINSPGRWVRDKGLFLIDEALEISSTVIVTEGPRDGLRLFQFGLPATSILGVTNWTTKKAEFMLELGVERVLLCLDADGEGGAGDKGTMKVKEDLQRLMQVRTFNLEKYRIKLGREKLDPGASPPSVIKRIKRAWERVRDDE